MRSTTLFPCIMTMISNFTVFFIFEIFIFNFFLYKYNRFLRFHMIAAAFLIKAPFFFCLKLVIFIACFFKNSQNFFMQSLPLYRSFLFSILLNGDIVVTETPDGIYLLNFVVDEFPELFLDPSMFQDLHK